MKNRIVKICFLMLFVFLTPGIEAFAGENTSPMVVINGMQVEFDVSPVIENGRTLIPVRAVSEKLKYDVLWDEENKKVEITNGDEKLELFIDKQEYLKNGEEKQMDVPAKITDGRTLVPLRLLAEEFGCTVRWLPEEYTAEIVKHETVTVTNAKEFLEAIGSYKKIILKEGEYNLSKAEEIKSNDKVAAHDSYDGKEYIVFEATELIIEGDEGNTVTVVIEPRYANVLTFMYCNNITVKNITAGHTIEPGNCTGGVLRFEDCSDVAVDNCRLYGCGTYGVTTVNSENINVKNTEIYECTYGVVDIFSSSNIFFDNCIFRDSEEFSMFSISESTNIGIYNSVIRNNKSGEYSALVGAHSSEKVHFKNCEFENNTYTSFSEGNVYFENCKGNE